MWGRHTPQGGQADLSDQVAPLASQRRRGRSSRSGLSFPSCPPSVPWLLSLYLRITGLFFRGCEFTLSLSE